jgi:hypothetical protein
MGGIESPHSLAQAFDRLRPTEILGWDLVVGVLGGAGGLWLALAYPQGLRSSVPVAATLMGVVIGAVLAGVAVLAAFLDQGFLRKVRAINREPVRYLSPLLFTAALGIVASILLLVIRVLPNSAPTWLMAVLGALAGLSVLWTLASVIRNLNVLVQFIGLQFEASDLPDLAPSDEERHPVTRRG